MNLQPYIVNFYFHKSENIALDFKHDWLLLDIEGASTLFKSCRFKTVVCPAILCGNLVWGNNNHLCSMCESSCLQIIWLWLKLLGMIKIVMIYEPLTGLSYLMSKLGLCPWSLDIFRWHHTSLRSTPNFTFAQGAQLLWAGLTIESS